MLETIYTIHNNFNYCSVYYNEHNYAYLDLNSLLKKRGKKYIRESKIGSKSIIVHNDFENYKDSTLNERELQEYFLSKKRMEASSWKSRQRALRAAGKLEQYKIDNLNRLGMLWDPTNNHWEMMFDKYRSQYFLVSLNSFISNNFPLQWDKLKHLNNLWHWEKEQRKLYKNGNIEEENLIRLKFISFPFEFESKKEDQFNLKQLFMIVNDLRKLNHELIDSKREFMSNYGFLKAKRFLGQKFEIKSSLVGLELGAEIIENKTEYQNPARLKLIKEDGIKEKEDQIKKELMEVEALKQLRKEPAEYFIEQMDRINRRPLYFDRISGLEDFLGKYYYYREKKIWVENICDNEIKRLASEKIILILDEKLLPTGRLNNKKSFKAISFLLNYHKKENNLHELLKIKDLIKKHQILSIIYNNRIDSIIKKYGKA